DRICERRLEWHRPVEGYGAHVEIVNGPHLRLLVLVAWNECQRGAGSDEAVDHVTPGESAQGADTTGFAIVRLLLPVAGRNLYFESLKRDERHVPAEQARDAPFDAEAADGYERRHIAPASVADDEPFALGAQSGENPQREAAELDLAVEPCGEHRDEFVAS